LLYQELLRFHSERKDTAALIDVNINRIQFARNNGSINREDSLYYEAVKEMTGRFKANRHAAQAWYLVAQWHADKAHRYNPVSDTTNRWENVKALEIAQRLIPLTDSTEGHYNLFNLYHSIVAQSLNLQIEQVNVPGSAFRTLITYKNADTIYYRVIKASRSLEDSLDKAKEKLGWNAYFTVATKFAYLRQERTALPKTNDYQTHNVEVKMDALPVGKYYLLSSTSPYFSSNAKLSFSTFHVSNISFINNGTNYFVLDRTSGQPLPNASIQIWSHERNYRRSKPSRQESYVADENGHFKLAVKKDNNRNVQLEINHGKDYLFIENEQYVSPLYYYNNEHDDEKDTDEEYEEDHVQGYFFTDRSIYRPGQIVYFKMLALTKDRKTKKLKLYTPEDPKEKKYVFLNDVNHKKIDSLLIKLSPYSSFAGSFKLPSNALTGQFSLNSINYNGQVGGYFSVEEYKRPTYSVQLEKPKGTYRLHDTLTVTGTAKAYAGNKVDGATVKYRVTRKGRFLYHWRWYGGRGPATSEATVTFGEATTDGEGKFIIKFAATPDETVSEESLPIFDFHINADVTDVAGETRSSQTTVSAGYHSLNLRLNVKETEEVDSLKQIVVNTTNIAGEKEPASVKINIYSLLSPKELIRDDYGSNRINSFIRKMNTGNTFLTMNIRMKATKATGLKEKLCTR
jgi:hypothetical protein